MIERLAIIGVGLIGGSLALYAWRHPRGRAPAEAGFHWAARESLLLGNNLVLAAALGSVMLGTLYPLALDVLAGQCHADALSLGRILRRWSLDELPQLINVLGGSMSLVGPRPHAVDHNEHYRQLIPGYMQRHSFKPGMTGLAQVEGFRGETPDLQSMASRIDADLRYQKTWSLTLDLSILLRTLLHLRSPRAY
jgi:hypothetical protein